MKSFPGAWTSYINGSFNCFYVIHVTCQDSTLLDFATLDTTALLAWNKAQGRLAMGGAGSASIRADVRQGGGIAQVSDIEFQLLNYDNYFDDTLSAIELTNAEVILYRHIVEAAPALYTSGLRINTYRVYDWGYDKSNIWIKCKVNETDHKEIPRTFLNEKDFSTLTIPDESNGKPVPICFGQRFFEAFLCSKDDDPILGPFPCTGGDTNTIEDATNSPFLDSHVDKIMELIGGLSTGQIGQIVIKDSVDAVSLYDKLQDAPVADDTVYQITDPEYVFIVSDQEVKSWGYLWFDTAKPLIFYREKNQNVILPFHIYDSLNDASPLSGMAGFKFKSGIIIRDSLKIYYPLPFTSIDSAVGWNNSANMIDYDETTRADGSSVVLMGGVFFTSAIHTKMISDHRLTIGEWDKIYFYVMANITSIDTGWFAKVYIDTYNYIGTKLADDETEQVNESGGGNAFFNNIKSYLLSPGAGFPNGANIILADLSDIITDWDTLISNRIFRISMGGGAATPTADMYYYINEMGLMLEKSLGINTGTKFFVEAKGRMFGGTWGARKTAINLVENPGDVLEKILRDDLGVTATYITTSDFDLLTGTDRSGWEMAYQIKSKINSIDEFKEIMFEACSVYYMDYLGNHTIKALPLTGTSVKTMNLNDVLCRESDKGLVPTFRCEFSPLEDVVNDFYVHYNLNYATGEYDGLAFINHPEEGSYSSDYVSTMTAGSDLHGNEETYWDLIHASYSAYGFVKTKHIYLDRIVDPATAENFLAFMISWLYLRKAEVSFYTQLQNCDLEFGDVVTLTDKLREGQYFVYGIHEDLNNDEIFLEMREL
ncbi:MAG TPA: hypothetical protein VMV56_07565 [Williamwhitmania sp.]|nr:hypothetical protein [Williamwhitmania sp.]